MPVYQLNINGKKRSVDVAADTPLLWVLRDHLDLPGTKFGCRPLLHNACIFGSRRADYYHRRTF